MTQCGVQSKQSEAKKINQFFAIREDSLEFFEGTAQGPLSELFMATEKASRICDATL
jgi:hypothetical protein